MTALYLLAGVCGLIWLAAILLRGGLLAGCLVLLLAGTCFGYPFFHIESKPLPLTTDRVLWVGLIAQCLVWRRFRWTERVPLTKADCMLAIFLAVLAMSTFTSDWRYRNLLPASRLLFYYLLPSGVYWVARQTRFTERATRVQYAAIGLFGVYLAVTAIAETRHWTWLVFPRYIASQNIIDFLGRGRGPLLNPAAGGWLLAIGMSAALMAWPTVNRPGRLSLFGLLLLFAGGVFCTYTRCAWMGALSSLLIVVGLTMPRAARLPLIAGSLLLAAALAATQWESLLEFKRDEGQSQRESAESVRLRPLLAVVAWKMFLQRPLFGCGFGHYMEESTTVLNDRDVDMPLEKARPYVQHNVLLGLLTETGLLGMISFSLVIGYWVRDAWRLWRSEAPLWARQQGLLFLAAMGSYVCNGMFQDLLIVPMINMILFYLAGAVAAQQSGFARRESVVPPPEAYRGAAGMSP
ncbi:MAG TPA: O-antigen ligase family protein [Pirellulales bacterium]|nr:O-antigen ligase family protein [Pirellulales bacterium]